jgi:acetylornithine deacetylase/succinyl-diaminopimelate desuccinylase-like protein
MVEMTFDRLRHTGYAESTDIAPVEALRSAFAAVGERWSEPVAWPASCDGEVYHRRGCPVAIFGAGRLGSAGSASEYTDVADIQKALAISTLATWSMVQAAPPR